MSTKLFIDRTSYPATFVDHSEFKTITVIEDNKELFSITKYRRAMTPPTIKYTQVNVPVYIIELSIEINKNFEMHLNYLKVQ
jgi:hypothetical protein